MGRIVSSYGVRGMVKVQPFSSEPDALLAYRAWQLRGPGSQATWRSYAVKDGRAHGSALVALLEGIATPEAAAALRGFEVGVARAELPAPAPGEHYWSDLEGMRVMNRQGRLLGEVRGIVESGAHPILRIVGSQGAEILIPWVAAYVDGVDAAARTIAVDWQSDY
jgi:16S rRNA processing protein RimM